MYSWRLKQSCKRTRPRSGELFGETPSDEFVDEMLARLGLGTGPVACPLSLGQDAGQTPQDETVSAIAGR
jgi:hypothetical protein